MLPYGKQTIEKDDIAAVIEALESNWLTTGPKVQEFENAFAESTGASHAVAVNSGTAALHAAMFAAGVGERPNDEVIVPAITFVATANAAIYLGAKPVFADVDPNTIMIDPQDVARKITPQTRAIVAMDYAGQPCDYAALQEIADKHQLTLIADACHSLGGSVGGKPVGSFANFTCFSLHPLKQITAGEGGVVVTDNGQAATAMKSFRNHGITTDHRQRERAAQHQYAMESLGCNYRLTDMQCALGLSQLGKLNRFTRRRNDVARFYKTLIDPIPYLDVLECRTGVGHAYHLFVVRWNSDLTGTSRDQAFELLRSRGIGVNVHYQPVYRHPFYEQRFGDQTGCCPKAERVYSEILSLPIFPQITEADIRRVIHELMAIGGQAKNQPQKAA
jgi:perosamine synthetase